jgi:hypothetical protein
MGSAVLVGKFHVINDLAGPALRWPAANSALVTSAVM